MNMSKVHLLDLPNEILLTIMKKLDNIDILYSLCGIKNKRLDILVQNDAFMNTLNFVTSSSIIDLKIDRLSSYILPRMHRYIKKLILDTKSMKRILLAGNYPCLTYLELFNFQQEISVHYFTHESIFRHIFKYQITDLILHNSDEYSVETLDTYTTNVYIQILDLFENLKHLAIVPSSVNEYPPLRPYYLPPTTYFSPALTTLCINLLDMDSCLYLLDGRLKQLTTVIVQTHDVWSSQSIPHNMDQLPNLKCFSLTNYTFTDHYDDFVVPLLRRMTHLEKLTLYLRTRHRSVFIDGTNLYNDILIHMSHLQTFIFYISTQNYINPQNPRISTDDIQQTLTNTRYGQTTCIVDYFSTYKTICHIFSLPFTFTCLQRISNQFPAITFNSVTYLSVYDMVPFKHEFFFRVNQAFPLLKHLCEANRFMQSWNVRKLESDNDLSSSIIEYSHLTSLDIMRVNIDYVVQFLLITKTRMPNLTELKIDYEQLRTVTMDFTRDETRCNCVKVNRLILEDTIVFPKTLYEYFPSL